MINHKQDKLDASKWAFEILQTNAAILDTETTGLGNTAEICQISVIDMKGNTLLDSLVKPTVPISESATEIHGITDEMVKDAYPFTIVYRNFLAVTGDKDIVIYNANYDTRLIEQSLKPFALKSGLTLCHCAMLQYSKFVGDWNPKRKSYTWQKLPNGDHSALGDCRATLSVIREMAEFYSNQLECPF